MTTLEEAVLFLLENHTNGSINPLEAARLARLLRDPYLKEARATGRPRGEDGFGSTDDGRG